MFRTIPEFCLYQTKSSFVRQIRLSRKIVGISIQICCTEQEELPIHALPQPGTEQSGFGIEQTSHLIGALAAPGLLTLASPESICLVSRESGAGRIMDARARRGRARMAMNRWLCHCHVQTSDRTPGQPGQEPEHAPGKKTLQRV